MAKPPYRNFVCPECGYRHRQRLYSLNSEGEYDDPYPDRCERCLAWMNTERPPIDVEVPEAPGIGGENVYAKSVNQVYRQMEADSVRRAYEAADILQVPVSEVSDIKITNMRDPSEMREGDTAAITTPPPKTITEIGQPGFFNLGATAPPTTIGMMGMAPTVGRVNTPVARGHAARVDALVATGKTK